MENFCYHGIGESLIKFLSVMKHGIVSERMAEGMEGYTKQFDGYNGNDKISVVIPHEADEHWRQYIVQADALGMFILKGGISFKIENCPYVMAQDIGSNTELYDEGFVTDKIPKDNITGIIVTSMTREKKISELSFLGANHTEQAIPNVRNLMQLLMQQGISHEHFNEVEELICQYEIAKSTYNESLNTNNVDLIKRKAEMDNVMRNINRIIANYFEKIFEQMCGKSPVTVMDVIGLYNDKRLPIYDENDVEQECKGIEIEMPKKKNENSEEIVIPNNKIPETSTNAIQKSVIEGSFIKKVFGLKHTIEILKNRWKNRNKPKENTYERGE